jgi:hypothetical protein
MNRNILNANTTFLSKCSVHNRTHIQVCNWTGTGVHSWLHSQDILIMTCNYVPLSFIVCVIGCRMEYRSSIPGWLHHEGHQTGSAALPARQPMVRAYHKPFPASNSAASQSWGLLPPAGGGWKIRAASPSHPPKLQTNNDLHGARSFARLGKFHTLMHPGVITVFTTVHHWSLP